LQGGERVNRTDIDKANRMINRVAVDMDIHRQISETLLRCFMNKTDILSITLCYKVSLR